MASKLTIKPNPTLQDLQQYVAAAVAERQFRNDPDVIPQRFMMLLEECGELARAARATVGGKFADDTKRSDIQDEAADVFIILLGICNLLDIDLEQAVRSKEEKNKQRTWQ